MPSNTRSGGNSSNGAQSTGTTTQEWIEIDKLYVTPTFNIRSFASHEKLRGNANYKTWKAMIKLDLRALNLMPFIESECGMQINVSPARRVMLDAQTVQFLRASVSENICRRITQMYSAYKTFEELKKLFGGSRCQDFISLHNRCHYLKYRAGFDVNRFIADFDRVIDDYKDLGTIFTPEYEKTMFLHKIDGVTEPKSPFFSFYTTMTALPEGTANLDYVKTKFKEVVESLPKMAPKMNTKRERSPSLTTILPEVKKKKTENSSSQSKVTTQAKPLREKYTEEQLAALAKMSREDKIKIQCKKCGEYYHSSEECPNPGKMCFKCFGYGHERKTCKYNKQG